MHAYTLGERFHATFIQFPIDLAHAWLPWALPVGFVWYVICCVPRARRNARVRAERRAREAWRAPVYDLSAHRAHNGRAARRVTTPPTERLYRTVTLDELLDNA